MLKRKLNLKILLAMGIILIAMCVFNLNTVNATDMTEEAQAILDLIPDEMSLDIKESQAYDKADDLVKQKVEEILAQNNIDATNVYVNFKQYADTLIDCYFYTKEVNINIEGINTLQKTIKVEYNNTNNKNSTDEQYIKSLIKSPEYFTIDNIGYMYDMDEPIYTYIKKYYSSLINDSSIEIKELGGLGGMSSLLNYGIYQDYALIKDDLVYDVFSTGEKDIVPVVTVPSSISDNDVIQYVTNMINSINYPDFTVVVSKIVQGNVNDDNNCLRNLSIPNAYSVYATLTWNNESLTNEDDISVIIVNREQSDNINKTDATINIKTGVTVSNISNKTYTGSAIKPNVTVKYGSTTLKNGTDYTLSYSNNKNTGKATITITGKGNYTGTITKNFYIVPKKVTGLKAKSQTTTKIKLAWTKATGATGYEVYQYNSSTKKWKKIKTTTSTSYTVSGLKAGTTYKFRVRAYKTVSSSKKYGSYSSTLTTTTKTKTPKISKITAGSKKATVKWSKVPGATGYEVYMSTSKSKGYSKIKTITKSNTVSYKKTKLKKGKTYSFKIRTYKTVSGKKIYSNYSTVNKVKVK